MVIFLKNYSIWNEGIKPSETKKLDMNKKVDVLVIGGGITGISCCYHLMNSKLKVALVEANHIGSGITSKTTGKLTFLQDGIYSKIKKASNLSNAKLYYEAEKEAIDVVKEIVEKEKIKCNLEESNSYLFTEDEQKIDTIKEEKEILESFGEKIKNVQKLPDGNICSYGIEAVGNYSFHPLKYLEELKKKLLQNNVEIYENSRVYSINDFENYYLCKVGDFFIQAKKVVLALHYPYFLTPFLMPFKVHLEKSYVGAFLEKDKIKFNSISLDKPVKSVRFYKNGRDRYKIFLYGSRNIAMEVNDKKHFEQLEKFPYDYKYMWSNIDVMTGDYIPYIGEIKDNLFLATGYNTWGMTNGSIAGVVIKDLILGHDNKYRDLFDPLRGVKVVTLPLVFYSNGKSYLESKINLDKSWYEKVRIEEVGGKKIGVYVDSDSKEHKVYMKCPHMGCNVVFNEKEETWDCPCHGSRFDVDGKVIDGPANYNITYKEGK